MNIEDAKNFSETLKNTVLTIAIIVGGIWSLYVFSEKFEAERAETELIKLKQDLVQRPILSGALETDQIYEKKNKEWIIKIFINLRNIGEIDSYLDLDSSTIRVARVNFEKGKVVSYSNVIYDSLSHIALLDGHESKMTEIRRVILLSKQEKKLESIVKVKEDGVYRVDFMAGLGKQAMSARKKAESFDIKTTYSNFGLSRILVIERNPNKSIKNDVP